MKDDDELQTPDSPQSESNDTASALNEDLGSQTESQDSASQEATDNGTADSVEDAAPAEAHST